VWEGGREKNALSFCIYSIETLFIFENSSLPTISAHKVYWQEAAMDCTTSQSSPSIVVQESARIWRRQPVAAIEKLLN
jgi:hypothetical protein